MPTRPMSFLKKVLGKAFFASIWKNKMDILIVVLSVSIIALLLRFIFSLAKISLFHPAVFFSLYAIVDVYFPAAYWSLYGQITPQFLQPLQEVEIATGVLFYSAFFVIFVISCVSIRIKGKGYPPKELQVTPKRERRLRAVIYIALIFTILKFTVDIVTAGGFSSWVLSKLVLVSLSVYTDTDTPSLLTKIPVDSIFQALSGVAFLLRKNTKYKFEFTYFFPLLSLMIALSAFLRGSVLLWCVTLLFSEYLRRKADTLGKINLKPVLTMAFLAIVVLYGYGAIRNGFRNSVSQQVVAASDVKIPTFLSAGYGLLGVCHIVNDYGTKIPFMAGKTYIDMLLLPVPRSLYPSKPIWYGIDDITRTMGWPESTQSAVTMPGEAYANFGIFGVLIAIPLGLIFGFIHKTISKSVTTYALLGPTFFFQMTSVSNWMSFTGFVNSLQLVIILLCIAPFIEESRPNNDTTSRRYQA